MKVSIFLFLFFWSISHITLAEPPAKGKPAKVVPVIAYEVGTESLPQTIKAIGHLQARDSVNIASGVSETIEKLHFKDGQWVRKGQLLVELNAREEKALLNEAKELEQEAKRQYDRVKEVEGRGNVTISLVDERYRQWKTASAKRSVIEALIADRRITAPFAGRVGFHQYATGAFVQAGSTIVTLDDTREMKLLTLVPSRYLNHLNPGQAVTVEAAAYPGVAFAAKVKVVAPRLDASLRMVQLQIAIPNKDQRLKPNMMVNAALELPDRKVLRVPNSAIQMIGERQFVYKLSPPKEQQDHVNRFAIERVEIQSGQRGYQKTEIVEGVQLGDIIVSQGVMKLARAKLAKIKAFEGEKSDAELLKPKAEMSLQSANNQGS